MRGFAANISTLFTALPLLERFAAAANAGFTAVELQFPYTHKPAELATAAQEAGVDIVLLNIPAGDFAAGERGLACLPGRETEFHDAVTQAAAYANACGCQRVNCLAGNVPDGANPEECWDVLVANLRTSADRLAGHNVALLIEPLNRADNPHFILNGAKDAAALITAVGKNNLALQYDTYHSHQAGEDFCAMLAQTIDRIGHIQFSDAPGRGAPGSGTLDFARFFRMLEHLPYTGWVGCEYFDAAPDFSWAQAYQLRL